MKEDKVRKYTLVIEYINNEDRCEYIKESITESGSHSEPLTIGEIDLYDYFDEKDIDCLTSYTIAKT
jgi:hypothetical protein